MNERKRKLLVLSIWEDFWSLGEGSGVPDELHFIRYLTERGYEIHYLIPEPEKRSESAGIADLTFHTYPNIFRMLKPVPGPIRRFLWPAAFTRAVLPRLREIAGRIGPDLILGFTHYSPKPLHIVGGELGIPTAVKLFGVMYLGRFDLPRIRYKWFNFEQIRALRHPVDHYIVLNDGTQGDKALARLGIPAEKVTFLPNGMSMEWSDRTVDRNAVRRRMGLPAGDILLVTLARLVRSKRTTLFLRAASMLGPEAAGRSAVVIAGEGPERLALEAEARHLGIAERTFFTGAIPQAEVVDIFKACDIFVGTNELTNMSMPPCEAILCGVPVVAFDVSGTAEVVRNGETGMLVPEGDVAGLASSIETLITDEALRRRLGEGAASFGRRHFVSWDERIGMELSVLERLFGGGSQNR